MDRLTVAAGAVRSIFAASEELAMSYFGKQRRLHRRRRQRVGTCLLATLDGFTGRRIRYRMLAAAHHAWTIFETNCQHYYYPLLRLTSLGYRDMRCAKTGAVLIGFHVCQALSLLSLQRLESTGRSCWIVSADDDARTQLALHLALRARHHADRIKLISPDDPLVLVRLARGLRRGDYVLVFIDGPQNEAAHTSNATTTMFGHAVELRTGAVELAKFCGTDLFTLSVQLTSPLTARIRARRVFAAGENMSTTSAMNLVTRHLEQTVRGAPWAWRMLLDLRRHLVAEPRHDDTSKRLERDRAYKLHPARLLVERRKEGLICADYASCTYLRIDADFLRMIRALRRGGTPDRLRRRAGLSSRGAVSERILTKLLRMDALISRDRQPNGQSV